MKEATPDLIRVLARLKLRIAQADELVDWARAERIGGSEGQYLARLAELASLADLNGAIARFERAVDEAGYARPPEAAALWAYARQLASAIVLEAIDPFQACGLLCRIWLQLGQPDDLAVWSFLDDGLAPDGAAAIGPEEALGHIREQARRLSAGTGASASAGSGEQAQDRSSS